MDCTPQGIWPVLHPLWTYPHYLTNGQHSLYDSHYAMQWLQQYLLSGMHTLYLA